MKRLTSFVLLAFALLPVSVRAADVTVKRPNIVFFIADDLSVKDSSAYGATNIPGANMAALAKEGMTFDRAYATSPPPAPPAGRRY